MTNYTKQICLANDDLNDHFFFRLAMNETVDDIELIYFDHSQALLHFLQTTDSLPQVIVLDLDLPGNKNFECLLKLKRNSKTNHIPVVIWSSADDDQIKKSALQKGAQSYLPKLPDLAATKDVVSKIIELAEINRLYQKK